jgi:hypothetical protein
MSAASVCHVGRFTARYVISAEHPNPGRLHSQLNGVAERGLPGVLAAGLGRLLPAEDNSVWLIRRLDVAVELNASADDDHSTSRWTAQIVRGLAGVLQGGPDGQAVVHFPSWADYLGRFLVDLTTGRDWRQWLYRRWSGLQMLPTAAALRTAILDDPHQGLAALLGLDTDALARVIRALSATEASRTLAGLAALGANIEREQAQRAAWLAWERGAGDARSGDEAHVALRLYVEACRSLGSLVGPALADTGRALARLAHRAAWGSARLVTATLNALERGVLAEVERLLGPADALLLQPLLESPPDLLSAMRQHLGGHSPARTATEEPRHTPYGGTLLLLPRLAELPVEAATGNWPALGEVTAPALARCLILVKCLGGERARASFFDPVLRDLCGLDPRVSAAQVSAWLRRLPATALDSFLAQLDDWQRQQGRVAEPSWQLERVVGRGWAAGVLLSAPRQQWRFAALLHSATPGNFWRRLQTFAGREAPPRIVCTPALAGAAAAAFPGASLELPTAPSDNAGPPPPATHLAADLHYLALPRALCGRRAADLALSVAAQAMLRDLSWRLPGFAFSSPGYLWANVLNIQARVDPAPERWVVGLGRPPLALLLNLTGLARGSYTLPWLDGRTIHLYPED